MKHLWRTISVAVAVAVAAVPAILVDPSFAHYVASHPWAATYLPVVAGILRTVYKGYNERSTTAAESVSGRS